MGGKITLQTRRGETPGKGGTREVASSDRRNRGQGARPTNQYWGELI